MPTTKDLFDDFVFSRASADSGPDDRDNGDTYRTSEHQLIEVINGEPHIVAGWEHPGTIDASIWIGNEFTGWARRALEDKLRESHLVVMTILAPDDFDDGADIMWWGYPVECMSCGATLETEQRPFGLCVECVELRRGEQEIIQTVKRAGIQQQRGLHGFPLPKSRPGGR